MPVGSFVKAKVATTKAVKKKRRREYENGRSTRRLLRSQSERDSETRLMRNKEATNIYMKKKKKDRRNVCSGTDVGLRRRTLYKREKSIMRTFPLPRPKCSFPAWYVHLSCPVSNIRRELTRNFYHTELIFRF